MKNSPNNRVVYSTETGRVKPETPKPSAPSQPKDDTIRLQRQTKGRGGGTVIVISGIPLQDIQLKELAGKLKKKCGCGGTVKDGIMEIQGDHRDRLLLDLQSMGYKVRLTGG